MAQTRKPRIFVPEDALWFVVDIALEAHRSQALRHLNPLRLGKALRRVTQLQREDVRKFAQDLLVQALSHKQTHQKTQQAVVSS